MKINFITILGLASLALFSSQSHSAPRKQKYFYTKVVAGPMCLKKSNIPKQPEDAWLDEVRLQEARGEEKSSRVSVVKLRAQRRSSKATSRFLKCDEYKKSKQKYSYAKVAAKQMCSKKSDKQSEQTYFYAKVGAGQMYQRSYLKYENTYGLWAKAAPKSDIIPMVGLGYEATDHLLLDLELSYNRALYTYQDPGYPRSMFQKTEKATLMANGYYKFKSKYQVSPYLMAGLGASYNNAHALQGSYPPPRNTQSYGETAKKFWSLAWNLGAGLKYNLAKRFTIDLGYRYMDYGTVKMNAPSRLGWGKGKEKLAGNLFILSGYHDIF